MRRMQAIPDDWRDIAETPDYIAAQEYIAASFHEAKSRLLLKVSYEVRELLWGAGPNNFCAHLAQSPLVPPEKGPKIAVSGYFRPLPGNSRMQGFEYAARPLSYVFRGPWANHVLNSMHHDQRRALLDAAFARQLGFIETLVKRDDTEFETRRFLYEYIDRLESAYQNVVRGRRA